METVPGIDYELIEHLDFAETLPCEHSWHEQMHRAEPATYVLYVAHTCGLEKTFLICISGYEILAKGDRLLCASADQSSGCGALDHRSNFIIIRKDVLV